MPSDSRVKPVMYAPRNRRSFQNCTSRKIPMPIAVAVKPNSNMLAHGTRSAATPRSTVPPKCSTQPSTASAKAARW